MTFFYGTMGGMPSPFRVGAGSAAGLYISSLAILCIPAATAQGKWINLAPFPEPYEEMIGAAANGKMYVLSGSVSAPVWRAVGLVYEYDPAANKWTKRKPMALPAHHLSVAAYNNKIYVFGGFTGVPGGGAWIPINNAWEYDPANDSWKALAPMPVKRGAAVAAVAGERIYVIGGVTTPPDSKAPTIGPATAQRVLDTVEEYDLKSDTWRERASMPTPRNHTAAGVVDGKIYVIGGRIGAAFIAPSSNLSNVEAYDPRTDRWSGPLAKMPSGSSVLVTGVYDGQIYVAGGEFQDSTVQSTYSAFQAYNPATNTWRVLPPMVPSRHGVAGAILGNRFYAISGDVQSAGTGIEVSTPAATAFEFSK